jgi:hypothetical protein
MLDPDIFVAMMPLAMALHHLRVRYYVCGAVACCYYGMVRSTTDIDIVAQLSPRHLAPLVDELHGEYFFVSMRAILDAIAKQSCFNLIHLSTTLKVDVFPLKNRPYDRNVMDRVREKPCHEIAPIPRLSLPAPEDAILAKLERCHQGGETPERHWFDVVGVMKVSGPTLDRAYLDRWAGELGVADLLAKAWKEVEGHRP